MMRISIAEARNQRRLVVEGKLVAPWAAELKVAYGAARADLNGRELIVDLRHLTGISQEGENLLLELMSEGVKFRSSGVFTKQILKQVARRAGRNRQEEKR